MIYESLYKSYLFFFEHFQQSAGWAIWGISAGFPCFDSLFTNTNIFGKKFLRKIIAGTYPLDFRA